MMNPDYIQLDYLAWKNNKKLPRRVTVWLHDNLIMDLWEGYDMPHRAAEWQRKIGKDAFTHIVDEVCKHFGDELTSCCTFRFLDGITEDWSEKKYGPLVEVYRKQEK